MSISLIEYTERIIRNIETVIVGKRQQIELLMTALLCQGHVLVEDVPGTGKTMLASQLEPYNTDPNHPILIVLHHDGDNYGGGSESYYNNNFQSFVDWFVANPARFVCTTVEDYLEMFSKWHKVPIRGRGNPCRTSRRRTSP